MNLLSDIITYVRRIIKSPSNASISDNLIVDYINRFWLMDMDARLQLFDLKTKYAFQTRPGVDQYNMPLYDAQTQLPDSTSPMIISPFPVYQGFLSPAYVNGVQVPLQTQKNSFFNWYPNVVQNFQAVGEGNGSSGPYTLNIPILSDNLPTPNNPPIQGILRGHVDIAGVLSTGNNLDPLIMSNTNALNLIPGIPVTSVNAAVYITSIDAYGNTVVVSDSGVFLDSDVNQGLLISPGKAPTGNDTLPTGYTSSFAITAITQATQAVLTSTTTFGVGQVILISGVDGMTELNGNYYTVVAVNATTVTINVDSTGFTAYTSGGIASSVQNTVNYLTGEITVFFPVDIPEGNNINVQCYLFQTGLPRAILFYNNVLTLRSPPDKSYLVELDAYLTPAAFLSTGQAIPYGYMAEYIARGAARKILSDTGDVEQFQFYEPLFKEQELLVWKRSQRQWTATRTETIYSSGGYQGIGSNYYGGTSL